MADPSAGLTRRDQFLLHMYDKLWESIDRVESGVWQFVALWAVIIGLMIGVGQAKVPPSAAAFLSVIISFWGINIALNASKWYNRNLMFVVNVERQFIVGDLGRIIPEGYHQRDVQVWESQHKIHALAFLAAGGVATWYFLPQAPRCGVYITIIVGTALTIYHWQRAASEIRDFINSTNPDKPG